MPSTGCGRQAASALGEDYARRSIDFKAHARKVWIPTSLQEGDNLLVAEAMAILGTDADEIVVDAARQFRTNVGPNEHAFVNGFNEQALAHFGGA